MFDTDSNCAIGYEFYGLTATKDSWIRSILGRERKFIIVKATHENQYIDELNKIIQFLQIDFFIPNSDLESYVAAKYINSIKCQVVLPTFREMEISESKHKTYEFCKAIGIKVPHTEKLNTKKNFIKVGLNDNEFPKWLRLATGAGSKHTGPVYSKEDIVNFIEGKVKYLDLEWGDFLISDFLEGDDCLITSIWNMGELKYLAMAQRETYIGSPGQSPPNRIRTIYRKELEVLLINTVKNLNVNATGIYNIDVKYDGKGIPNVTEFNHGRFYYNMSLFNNGEVGMFDYFLNLFLEKKNLENHIKENDWLFLREQDKAPTVIHMSSIY